MNGTRWRSEGSVRSVVILLFESCFSSSCFPIDLPGRQQSSNGMLINSTSILQNLHSPPVALLHHKSHQPISSSGPSLKMPRYWDSKKYAVLLGISIILLALLSGYVVVSWHAPTILTRIFGLLFIAIGIASIARNYYNSSREPVTNPGEAESLLFSVEVLWTLIVAFVRPRACLKIRSVP